MKYKIMWTLKDLLEITKSTATCINGKWVPARPENYKKKYLNLFQRLHRAYLVFSCKADCFTWPENQ